MVSIAVLLMVKDESARILTTLSSVQETVDTVFLYDTGSVDDTVELVEGFCSDGGIQLHILHGEFVDFATSRNNALEFARGIGGFDYILLMDANDELRGGDELLKIAHKELTSERVAYFLQQQLEKDNKITSFYNVRLLKSGCDWLYSGSVHESFNLGGKLSLTGKLPDVILYQDRAQDDFKSQLRYQRDYGLLLQDHIHDPNDPRIVYYLGQTADCLGYKNSALQFHKLRSTMSGDQEERFLSTFRVGCLRNNIDEKIMWWLKSFTIQPRVEPLVKIADVYLSQGQITLAKIFAELACTLNPPTDNYQFVDMRAYDYIRWEILEKIQQYVTDKN